MPGESGAAGRAAALGTALTAAVAVPVVAGTGGAAISAGGYTFTEVTALGQPAPGGGTFVNDFEPSAINSSGALGFTADVSTGGEGVFIAKGGTITQVMRSFMPAPGGVMTDYGELGRLGLNDQGDLVTGFVLSPQTPTTVFGVNAGVFRFTASTGTLSTVAVPGQTMPRGGTMEGTYVNYGINNRGDVIYQALATGSAIAPGTPPNYNGMSLALYEQSQNGTSTRIVAPGRGPRRARVRRRLERLEQQRRRHRVPAGTCRGTRASTSASPTPAATACTCATGPPGPSPRSPTRVTKHQVEAPTPLSSVAW